MENAQNRNELSSKLFSGPITSKEICSKCSTPIKGGQPWFYSHDEKIHGLPDDCIANLKGAIVRLMDFLVSPDDEPSVDGGSKQ